MARFLRVNQAGKVRYINLDLVGVFEQDRDDGYKVYMPHMALLGEMDIREGLSLITLLGGDIIIPDIGDTDAQA